MAIYRADKAVMSFATEAAQGGTPEAVTTAASSGSLGATTVDMASNGLPAGSLSVTVASTSGIITGEFIQLGDSATQEKEIRRVEYVEGTTKLHLDTPTAFFHPHNTVVTVRDSIQQSDLDKFMTFVPGVYESIDVPDPEMNIDPRYLLGTSSNRNFYNAYKSSQNYNGGVGSFTLLNGWPLRFPIGKITSIAKADSSPYTSTTYFSAAAKKGDYWIAVNSDSGLIVGDVIVIDHADTPVSTSICEARRIVAVSSDNIRLNYPLHFDHPIIAATTQIREVDESATGLYYQHDIFETSDLDTVSWNVLLRDSGNTAANDIIRRYYGGKIGGASISASEEGMLTMSWDSVPFLGMNHNQADHSAVSDDAYSTLAGAAGGGYDMPGYSLVQTIDDTDIGDTSTNNLKDRSYPSTNPYFFSDGTLSLFGTSFARVSDFNISIDNAVESRYYINTRHGKLQRGPSEHREGARAYNMSATLALPDSAAATGSDRTLFKELLLEGDYGTNTVPNHSGFDITLSFSRGTNDSIVFTIPSDGSSAKGGNEQGAFITSATHNIGGSGILAVDASMIFRNMKIQIKDSALLYP
jgi:hypothetical protein